MARSSRRDGALGRLAAVMAICTVILTAAIVGVIGVATGQVTDTADRLPYYVVVFGLVFVATIILLESHGSEGRTVVMSAIITATVSFAAVSLAVEGVLVAYEHPEQVVTSQLLYYVFAAGMIGTGLGYWGIRHWREFAPTRSL